MPLRFESSLNRLQFALRDRVLGRFRLRSGLPLHSSPEQLGREEAFYRLILERALPPETRAQVDVAWDIGCRNWSYAGALASHFPRARLVGVEVDGKRRYWNLYRREDAARAHARRIEEQGRSVELYFRDFRKVGALPPVPPVSGGDAAPADPLHAFCFFFPFVSPRPCVKWGLPEEFADYGALLDHARALSSRRHILSIHQGEWEAELAREFYSASNLSPVEQVLKPEDLAGLWPERFSVHLFSL